MARRRVTLIGALISFAAGVLICNFGPRVLRRHPLSFSHTQELARVTSTNGQFDAVMVLEQYGGAAGGNDWYVYIVPKGKLVPPGLDPVFSANELDRDKLIWKQPHLLEIHYDVGEIYGFSNLWCSDQVKDVGVYGERDFCVEIRLAPSTPDFSILDPSGEFRHIRAD